jgi:UDP-N-acetyl-D-mannosaminuronic acid dehydrogenase
MTLSPARAAQADLTVVGGGGHVGIPLVLAFAEAGLRVNVHDLDCGVLDTLRSGRLPFIEEGGGALLERALKHKRLLFTSDPAQISPDTPVIITIGTPVDEFQCAASSRTASMRFCRISPTASF